MAWIPGIFLQLSVLWTLRIVSGATCPGTENAGGCYVIDETPRNWAAARDNCRNLAASIGRPNFGSLTSVVDQTQNTFVVGLVNTLLDQQTSFAAKDALRVMWIGGYEESAARGDSPLPYWRWLDDTKDPLQLQGCFNDNPNAREFAVHTVFSDLSPQKCLDYCYGLGYTLAATRQGDTCSCGETYGKYGTATDCYSICRGHWSNCGGIDKNNVYIINGSYSGWTSNQPNNYDNYQACGHVERYIGASTYTMGDKFCREALNYVCSIPMDKCDRREAGAYKIASGTTCAYLGTGTRMNWFKAREDCRTRGGDLVTLASSELLSSLSDLLVNTFNFADPLWIGAVGRKWKWDDGQDFIYTFFPSSHPINMDYNCLQLFSTQQKLFSWEDADCSKALPSICYIDMITPLPTTTTTSTTTTTIATTPAPATPIRTTTKASSIPATTHPSLLSTHLTNTRRDATSSLPGIHTGTTSVLTTSPTTTNKVDNSTFPSAGASTGAGDQTYIYILVTAIVVVTIIAIILGVIFCNYKKKQKEGVGHIHPDKEVNVYARQSTLDYSLPQSDRETDRTRGIDEASTVTATNVKPTVNTLPELSSRVHEARFKLDPIVMDDKARKSTSREDEQKRKERKEKKRREKEESGGKEKSKKKKRSSKHGDNDTRQNGDTSVRNSYAENNVVVDMGVQDLY